MWTPALPEAAETVAWDTRSGGLGVGNHSRLAEHLAPWHLEASPQRSPSADKKAPILSASYFRTQEAQGVALAGQSHFKVWPLKY